MSFKITAMEKYITMFLFFLIPSTLLFSQSENNDKEIITVDKTLVDNIQLLHPDFFFTTDSMILHNNLIKFYINEKMSGDNPLKCKLIKDTTINKKKEQFLKMSEDFFWHNMLINERNKLQVTVSENELLTYYKNNLDKFKKPYTFSFWQAWVTTDDEEIIDLVKSKLQKMSKVLPKPEDEISKYSEESFAINFEFPCQFSMEYPLYPHLISSKINEIAGPFSVETSTVFIVMKERSGGETKPFDEVKMQCESELKQKKIEEEEKKRMDLIMSKYEFIISDELLNK